MDANEAVAYVACRVNEVEKISTSLFTTMPKRRLD